MKLHHKKRLILAVLLLAILTLIFIYISKKNNLIFTNNTTINKVTQVERHTSKSVVNYMYDKKYILAKGETPIIDILYLHNNNYINHQISLDDLLKIDVPKSTNIYISLNQMNMLEGKVWKVQSNSNNIDIIGDDNFIEYFSIKKNSKENQDNKFNRQLFKINTLDKKGQAKIYFNLNSSEEKYCLILNIN